jgi:hypothetical protein
MTGSYSTYPLSKAVQNGDGLEPLLWRPVPSHTSEKLPWPTKRVLSLALQCMRSQLGESKPSRTAPPPGDATGPVQGAYGADTAATAGPLPATAAGTVRRCIL